MSDSVSQLKDSYTAALSEIFEVFPNAFVLETDRIKIGVEETVALSQGPDGIWWRYG
jgi:hypothetical protein